MYHLRAVYAAWAQNRTAKKGLTTGVVPSIITVLKRLIQLSKGGDGLLSINYKDPRPIYEQVRDALRQLILSGAIKPEEKLPSVRELAGSLAINPNTIQRAYRELEAAGLIYTVAGKGAFATSDDRAAAQRREELLAVLDQTVRELKLLGMDCGAVTAEVHSAYGKEPEV